MSKRTAEKNRKIVNDPKKRTQWKKECLERAGKLNPTDRKKTDPNRKDVRISILGTRIFYNCPKCGKILRNRKKMHKNVCMECGQYLDWSKAEHMETVWIRAKNPQEVSYWARQYEIFHGSLYGLDPDQLRSGIRFPLLLYFAFPKGKGYGGFMRKAAKEAEVVKEFENGPD